MTGIKAIGLYLPKTLYPVMDLPEVTRLSDEERQIIASMGVDTVGVCEETDPVELAYKASLLTLDDAGLTPDELDVIIYLQSRVPNYLMSSDSARLKWMLNANKSQVFTISDLGCADINNGLKLSEMYLKDPNIRNVLIAYGSKPFSKERYRQGVTFIGDGGMGVIVSRTDRNKIVDIHIDTDGKYWDLYRVDYKNMLSDEYTEHCTNSRYKFELAIASRNRFKEMIQAIITQNGSLPISGIIMQNLSLSAYSFNQEALKIEVNSSCYQNCRKYGHLGSIDIMLNYSTALKSEEFNKGDNLLLLNNSPVACWSTMLLQV